MQSVVSDLLNNRNALKKTEREKLGKKIFPVIFSIKICAQNYFSIFVTYLRVIKKLRTEKIRIFRLPFFY